MIGDSISIRTVDAALRLARAEGATLVAAYLVSVPLNESLTVAEPEHVRAAKPLFKLIEQRAARLKVPVSPRVELGRTPRHALHELIERERFDRIVIPAAAKSSDGFSPDDIGWLLDHAPGEIAVLRPGSEKPSSGLVPKPVSDPGIGDDVPGL